MKYQLVLQWPASSIKDYDAMVEVEDALIEKISKTHDVDGHDAGSGEVNIFIRTEDPKRAFNEVKSILGTRDFWVDARIAYREVAGSEYTILWPKGLTEFKVTYPTNRRCPAKRCERSGSPQAGSLVGKPMT